MRKIKIKWGNVLKLIILQSCAIMFLHDLYTLAIYPFFSGKIVSLTLFGTITFILNLIIIAFIIDDLVDQYKSIPSYRPKHAKDTERK